MNFVADEGVDWPIVAQLRQHGHVVWYVAEMSPSLPDADVLALAHREQAILLTFDKDFGEMVFRQRQTSPGVVLLRLHGLSPQQKTAVVVDTVQNHGAELAKAFTVVTPTTLRIRPQKR